MVAVHIFAYLSILSIMSRKPIRKSRSVIEGEVLMNAWRTMNTARAMAELYDQQRERSNRYVHSTSKGHEAIQIAAGLLIREYDYAAPYYRDDAFMLAIGMRPFELMLQLLAKGGDPFSGGRSYYSHPSLKRAGFPIIPHQSSATGMQVIPATGMAHGLHYLESQGLLPSPESMVLCSIGDGAVTEGEVSEGFQMAVLHKLPILYLVQDNGWGISATGKEMRAMDAYEYAGGFPGLERMVLDGADFEDSYLGLKRAFDYVRKKRAPMLVHASCPLLGHHTSGVRREWYRGEDLAEHEKRDPLPLFRTWLIDQGISEEYLDQIAKDAIEKVGSDFEAAFQSPDPDPSTVLNHEFAPAAITMEAGVREPADGKRIMMVDAALHAIDEILSDYPEALFYGQDVGRRLGGVFREAATLAEKHGDARVFNTPIQEAYIIGSTAGMCAVGAHPIVEIQFADYIWPGINQLVEELSKSCYLSEGKFPIRSLIRVPTGAYGGGGPYHSGSIESTLLTIRGIKVVYPATAADIKGLLKAAFLDPNPVVMLEHKGLYWSKVPGTDGAKTIEPDSSYVIPLGKARWVQQATQAHVDAGTGVLIITYGMGVYWALQAAEQVADRISILDLRTLNPLDWDEVLRASRSHGKIMIVTEEPELNSFAESLAGRISLQAFNSLDAPVMIAGSANLPAIPLNATLEKAMLCGVEKVSRVLNELMSY